MPSASGKDKSASHGAWGLVYDKELGSSLYYKHSRMYRFPEFYDMVKTGAFGLPPVPRSCHWTLKKERWRRSESGTGSTATYMQAPCTMS